MSTACSWGGRRSVMADAQVKERTTPRPAPAPAPAGAGSEGGGDDARRSRSEPLAWRVVVLCALLVAAFALLAYAVTVTRDDGLEEFYSLPARVQPGDPGDLIKLESLDPDGMDGSLYRIMYHSRSITGRDIAVTGSVAIPSTPAPLGGRPV